MRLRLAAVEGPDRGTVFEFEHYHRVVLGRQGSPDLHGRRPRDRFLSRYHLLLETAGGACVVRDLGSRNGVLVNGVRTDVGYVAEGDLLRAGHSTFRVEVDRTTSTFPVAPPTARPPVPPGPSLDDYEGFERVAEGALGVVYRARERLTGRTVAVKTMKPEREVEEGAAEHFLREMALSRRLQHPHIVRVYAVGRDGGRLWIAMEYVDGPNLEEQVEVAGPSSPGDACRIGMQVLEALDYGHSRGIVHRDVKPANVLLEGEPGGFLARVADFGLATTFLDTGCARLTITGDVKGTPAYMAPEQVLDSKHVGPPADLYSLGATLYHALTRSWHHDDTGHRTSPWTLLLEAPLVPVAARRPDVPPALAAVVERALARDPAARPPSAQAMWEMLQEAWVQAGS